MKHDSFFYPLKLTLGFLVIVAVGLLGGCAGSALDRSFRSKVKSDTIDVQGTYDPTTNSVGGEIRNTLEFRDPKTVR
jgi:hypothetical protein